MHIVIALCDPVEMYLVEARMNLTIRSVSDA